MCLSCSLSAHRWVLCHIPGTKSQDQEEHTKPKDKSLTGAHRSPAGDFYCSSLTSRSGARVGLANAHVQGASAGHRDPYRRPGDKSLRLGEAGKCQDLWRAHSYEEISGGVLGNQWGIPASGLPGRCAGAGSATAKTPGHLGSWKMMGLSSCRTSSGLSLILHYDLWWE
ncbi:uncharacterized protein [Macaca nemestrina]|uniref:uncharacterized protein isoform X4 n=1 Tax=Macaca nemestrina TaxID=9545 RepID=UPI0039B90356